MRIKTAAIIGPVLLGSLTLITVVIFLTAGQAPAQNQSAGQAKATPDAKHSDPAYVTTPAMGLSWLKFMGIFNIGLTSMGQMGGDGPALPSSRIEPEFPVEEGPPAGGMGMGMGGMMGRNIQGPRYSSSELRRMMDDKFVLTGSDFFRLDCRACHGPEGHGAPPELNSLIGPIQATSAGLAEARMKKMGRPIGEEMAKELASQAEQSVLERLQKGGKKMPAFRHLQGKEVEALIQYLKLLVGAPVSQLKPILVSEYTGRVGEHLVKGTCQICHDATGPGIRGGGMMQGVIPSLASFPYEQSMQSVVWQVGYGSRRMMMMGDRQRMPAYPYITVQEGAAAYIYLAQYPPM